MDRPGSRSTTRSTSSIGYRCGSAARMSAWSSTGGLTNVEAGVAVGSGVGVGGAVGSGVEVGAYLRRDGAVEPAAGAAHRPTGPVRRDGQLQSQLVAVEQRGEETDRTHRPQ